MFAGVNLSENYIFFRVVSVVIAENNKKGEKYIEITGTPRDGFECRRMVCRWCVRFGGFSSENMKVSVYSVDES